MKRSFTLPSLLSTAVTVNTSAQSTEFASASCITGLSETGLISVTNPSGSQRGVERVVARRMDEQGVSWYRIIQIYEGQQPGSWRVQAILYV